MNRSPLDLFFEALRRSGYKENPLGPYDPREDDYGIEVLEDGSTVLTFVPKEKQEKITGDTWSDCAFHFDKDGVLTHIHIEGD